MPQTLVRYPLDTTGVNPDNLVRNEPHTLSERRFRAIAPEQGAIYVEGCTIVDTVNDRILSKDIDYVFAELYQSPTIKYGKEIVGLVIVINPAVSSNVKMTYQALGGDYSGNIEALVNLLETQTDNQTSDSYLDIINRPSTVVPQPHIHDLGDGQGFEFLVYALERLRSALVWADAPVIFGLQEKVRVALNGIHEMARYRLDTELVEYLNNFKKHFSKESVGLGKVVNMPLANENEGAWAARENFNLGGDINDRYITLRSLVAFKEELLSRLVSSETTNLGKRYGAMMLPTLAGLESLTNGARVIFDTYEATVLAGVQHDRSVYPDLTNTTSRWAIIKESNNPQDRGGVFSGFNLSTGAAYSGVLSISSTGVRSMIWAKLMTAKDSDLFLKTLTDHITDTRNPHDTTAIQVGLGQLENLPIADTRTILARKPVREYITYNNLLIFMRAFITNNWQIDPDDENPDPEAQARSIRAFQTLFAACGACAPCSGLTLETSPRETEAPVPVRGQEIGWHCEGTTKVVKITDGFGGFYIDNRPNSVDCGYVAPTATFAIRDLNDVVLGYGFPAGGTVDPEATVRIDNADGIAMCYIFATGGTGRTVEIRNASGLTIGYAIAP
jgi:hypothetical protein